MRKILRTRAPVSLEEFGLAPVTQESYRDVRDMHVSRVRLRQFGRRGEPKVGRAFVAPSAVVAGNVEVWDEASIWYHAVIRGDRNLVRIGHHTNIQDSTFIGEAHRALGPDHDGSTIVGHYVTVGHSCMIRAATIENFCLVGMRSILAEGSYMEEGSILGAGSVLLPGTHVPRHELWVGNPAKKLRDITDEEKAFLISSAQHYCKLASDHKYELDTDDALYQIAEKRNQIY